MTWQTGLSEISLGNFTVHGRLENRSDTNFSISPYFIGDYPGLAFCLDLGNITKTANTLVFGIGLIRDPVVSYRTATTTHRPSHLWYSRWNNIGSAVSLCFKQISHYFH